jgi:penicillin-binding protein A
VNAPIVRLFGLVTALFVTLVAFTSYWSVVDAKNLKDNAANRRPLLEEQRIRRGAILTADGETIAESFPRGSGSRRVYIRNYPQGTLYAHPVGYSFLERGRTGIERSHNAELVGERTEFLSILDQLRGRRQEGDELTTTLVAEAQRTATDALAGRAGSVVALDPSTGRVLTMVSVPGFDPNGVPDDDAFAALTKATGSPLVNRATQSGYPVGSTMKVVTAAAALDSGEFTPDSVVNGDSGVPISGVPLANFGSQDFGEVDLTTALTNSVNTVWAQVGESLGKETMFDYMRRFGFGAEPPLDYPSDQMAASGVFEGRRLLDAGDSVDIGRVAIGQERLKVTPLQMAMVVAAVANEGELMKPRFLDRVTDIDGRTVDELDPDAAGRVISDETAATLTEMMADVVREGTGTAAALSGIEVAGKTGTAERGGALNQAWFVGFAPLDDPQVAIAATVEETSGTGGAVAAPIARQVMQVLLGS